MKRIALVLAATSILALGACKKQAPQELPPPPQSSAAPAPAPAPSTPQGPAPGSQAHFAQQMQGRDTIYFDTDKFNVDAEDQTALAQQAAYLQQYPNIRATVEGHCDERGTREYNLALGERRANAAKNYLVSLGIAANRLTTVSYGKERPAALGSDEQAWAKNRRAVTIVLN
jgi:peptidoglycan-associated lipoprotein